MDVTSFTTPSGDHVMVKDAAARQSIATLKDAIAAIPDVDVNANTLEIVNAINLLLSKFRPAVACLAVAALSALQLAAGVVPKTSSHNRIDGDVQIVTNTVELIAAATNGIPEAISNKADRAETGVKRDKEDLSVYERVGDGLVALPVECLPIRFDGVDYYEYRIAFSMQYGENELSISNSESSTLTVATFDDTMTPNYLCAEGNLRFNGRPGVLGGFPKLVFNGLAPKRGDRLAKTSDIPDVSGFVPTSRTINGHPLTDDITIPTSEPESYGTVSNAAMSAAEAIPGLQGDVSDLYNSKVSTSYGSADNLTVSGLSVGYFNSISGTYYSMYGEWTSGDMDSYVSDMSRQATGFYYDTYYGDTRIYSLSANYIYPNILYAGYVYVDGWSSIYNSQTYTTLADVLSAYEDTLSDIHATLSTHVSDEENPHRVTPDQIGAITPSYVSTNNPAFVAEVMAVGMHIDPAVISEFNEAARRGNLASNIVFHVHRYFEDTQRAHYYFDPVLQRTWQISVSNGCFFSEIVDNDVRDR